MRSWTGGISVQSGTDLGWRLMNGDLTLESSMFAAQQLRNCAYQVWSLWLARIIKVAALCWTKPQPSANFSKRSTDASEVRWARTTNAVESKNCQSSLKTTTRRFGNQWRSSRRTTAWRSRDLLRVEHWLTHSLCDCVPIADFVSEREPQ